MKRTVQMTAQEFKNTADHEILTTLNVRNIALPLTNNTLAEVYSLMQTTVLLNERVTIKVDGDRKKVILVKG